MRRLAVLAVPVLVGLAAPTSALATPAAAPVVDIAIERTLNTPTDVFPVSPTRAANIDISIVNRGTAAQDAYFSFTVPAGWAVTPTYDLPSDEVCGPAGDTYRCTVDGIAAGYQRSTQLSVTAAATTPVGSLTTVVVTGGPVGAVDSDPSNNQTQFEFDDVGTSVLTATVTTSATSVVVGQTVTFTVTVSNAGPDATSGLGGFFQVRTETPDGFVQAAPVGPGTVVEGGDADPPVAGPSYSIEDYELAGGGSAVYTVVWTAQVLGAVGHLQYTATSLPDSVDGSGPVRIESDAVTVVAPGTTTTPPTTTPTATEPPLADTGASHVAATTGWGLGALVVGGVLVAIGAGRRRGRHAA